MVSDDLKLKLILAGGAVLLVGGLAWYLSRQAKQAAGAAGEILGKVGQAVNPFSDQNLAYQGVSKATTAITGDDRPFGVQLWEWLHPAQAAQDNAIAQPTLTAADIEDAELGYYMELARADQPYRGNYGQAVRGSFKTSTTK